MDTLTIIATLFACAAVALFAIIQRRLGSLEPNIIRLQLTFREDSFRQVLRRWGETGVRRFLSHFALDYALLICYAVVGVTAGTWLVARIEAPTAIQAALPWVWPVAAVFDATENKLHQALASSQSSTQPPALFFVAGVAATVKWVLLIGAIPVAGYAWFTRAA